MKKKVEDLVIPDWKLKLVQSYDCPKYQYSVIMNKRNLLVIGSFIFIIVLLGGVVYSKVGPHR